MMPEGVKGPDECVGAAFQQQANLGPFRQTCSGMRREPALYLLTGAALAPRP